jgi:Tfp pilus assembly protein PilO
MKIRIQPCLFKLRRELGVLGLAGMALLAAALGFSHLVVKPLEDRNLALRELASKRGAQAPANQQSAEKIARVYEFLQKEETPTDWLAKLHGIGVASGVQVKSATYRTQRTEGLIVRTEIQLPLAGSYAQIRDFMARALAEIPVMSVDSVSLKREGQSVHADLRLTLHMVKS